MRIRFGVITVSDRASRGERADESGPALAELIRSKDWEVARMQILPDDREQLRRALVQWADEDLADVVLTTGGTGFAPRDVTPEATLDVLEKEAPGLAESMRIAGSAVSPHAMLSRARAGIRGNVLIINLPGNPSGAVQGLQVVLPALEHAVELLRGQPSAEKGHKRDVV